MEGKKIGESYESIFAWNMGEEEEEKNNILPVFQVHI